MIDDEPNDEPDDYTRGQCDAYSAVFKAFTAAFADGRDIHWLRERIAAQWKTVLAMQTMGGVR